ncbi:hypothetical protein BASA81_001179 [Batrachochytrium salamandrivorans]|nr:hypothetical protein BASA81_001179 [Batrachochytrium salamandrivorans]
MCRLLAYVGPPICAAELLFRPTNSIVRQSFDAKQRANGAKLENPYAHGSLNADGFGMAFYGSFEGEDEEQKKLPCVFTELLPAWNSKNLRRLSEKVHAKLFFAHIRAAGPSPDGQVSICDCKTHPFTFGRYSFMHNGEIAGFALIRRKLLEQLKRDESFNVAMMCGATDTAVAFAIFVDQIPVGEKMADLSSTVILQMLKQTLELIYHVAMGEKSITGQSKLNFVVTDGRVVIATRYAFGPEDSLVPITAPSLYYSSGSNFKKPSGERSEFRISHSERTSRMTIVSSEPLTEVKGDWVSVPFNHVVVIQPTGETLCGPLYFQTEPCLGASEAALELDRSISKLEENFALKQVSNAASRITSPIGGARLTRMVSSSVLAPHYDLLDGVDGNVLGDGDHNLLAGMYGKEVSQPFHVLAFSGQVHVSCMAQMGNLLFVADGGTVGGKVCWFSLDSYELLAWSPSWNILALACCEERSLLFGSRSDGKILIWKVAPGVSGETHAFATISIPEVGHVLTMQLLGHTLVIGSQDGNLRRINVEDVSKPFAVQDQPGQRSGTMRQCVETPLLPDGPEKEEEDAYQSQLLANCSTTRSHCGFVNAVVIHQNFLFSAGSCSLIKRWALDGDFACEEVIPGHHRSVTDLCVIDQFKWLLSASLDGTVRAWRLSAMQTLHIKTFRANGNALTCLAPLTAGFCAGTVSGLVWLWKFQHEQHLPTAFLNVSASPVNSIRTTDNGLIFVGTKSGRITVWELPLSEEEEEAAEQQPGFFARTASPMLSEQNLDNSAMMASLKQFVAIPSVSQDPQRFDACLKSAAFIRQLVENLGGETRIVPGHKIPVVLAKFRASRPNPTERYVFVYGHHDVVDVNTANWVSPPFDTAGRESYLFGRGVSDNKGPCLAMLFATASLKHADRLGVDVMFCFEGENETNMDLEERGFHAMIRENRGGLFFPEHAPLLVVISNNTWITTDTPCLTYGMRGIVDIALKVTAAAAAPAQQSGGEANSHCCGGGDLSSERNSAPVVDLMAALQTCDALKIALDRHAAPLDEEEMDRLERVGRQIEGQQATCGGVKELIEGWISPAVSISAVHTSSDCFRKVPFEASAKVTVHFVPSLTEEAARELVLGHFEQAFSRLNTGNQCVVAPKFTGKWWVGDIHHLGFKTFSDAIERVWGQSPLLVRSGTRDSSMTVFLEREFRTCCVNFPMASNGDFAHQSNERIKVANLHKGREVFEQVLVSLGEDYLIA